MTQPSWGPVPHGPLWKHQLKPAPSITPQQRHRGPREEHFTSPLPLKNPLFSGHHRLLRRENKKSPIFLADSWALSDKSISVAAKVRKDFPYLPPALREAKSRTLHFRQVFFSYIWEQRFPLILSPSWDFQQSCSLQVIWGGRNSPPAHAHMGSSPPDRPTPGGNCLRGSFHIIPSLAEPLEKPK